MRDTRNTKVGRRPEPPVVAQKKYLRARAAGTAPAPVRRSRQPSLEPIGKRRAQQYATHPHPSTQSVRANIIARSALGKLAPDIAQSRRAAPGPAVSGYNFLGSTVGRNVGALVPGTLTAAGRRPHATFRGTLGDLAIDNPFLPFGRLGTVAKYARVGRLGGKAIKLGRAEVIGMRHLVGHREASQQRQGHRMPKQRKRGL
jgi:hypothetical protein